MKRNLLFVLIFFVICGLFVAIFSPVLVFGTSERCTDETIAYSSYSVENKNVANTIKNQPFDGEQIYYAQLNWSVYASPLFLGLLIISVCVVVLVVALLRRVHLRSQTHS
jgi:hypothetical protein